MPELGLRVRLTETANLRVELFGLLHVTYVSGACDNCQFSVGDGIVKLLGDLHRAASIIIAPQNQSRHPDLWQQFGRVRIVQRLRHQAEAQRVEVRDHLRHLFFEFGRSTVGEELRYPQGYELLRRQRRLKKTSLKALFACWFRKRSL